jgi:hypothetical protein
MSAPRLTLLIISLICGVAWSVDSYLDSRRPLLASQGAVEEQDRQVGKGLLGQELIRWHWEQLEGRAEADRSMEVAEDARAMNTEA